MTGGEHLLDEDRAFLGRKGWEVEVTLSGNERFIVVHGYKFPEKYTPSSADLLVKQPSGYPESGMDSFWTCPDITLAATGEKPQSAHNYETILGQQWQFWSRHGSWRPGIDTLETFFASINRELKK